MRAISFLLFFTVVQVASWGMALAADAPVFGTFALFEVNQDWKDLSVEQKQKAGEEINALLESFKNLITIDGYWTYGLTTDSHFMLRLHSSDLQTNQQFLTQLRDVGLGRRTDLEYTISGVVKALNYAPEFPELLEKLKSANYEKESRPYTRS